MTTCVLKTVGRYNLGGTIRRFLSCTIIFLAVFSSLYHATFSKLYHRGGRYIPCLVALYPDGPFTLRFLSWTLITLYCSVPKDEFILVLNVCKISLVQDICLLMQSKLWGMNSLDFDSFKPINMLALTSNDLNTSLTCFLLNIWYPSVLFWKRPVTKC